MATSEDAIEGEMAPVPKAASTELPSTPSTSAWPNARPSQSRTATEQAGNMLTRVVAGVVDVVVLRQSHASDAASASTLSNDPVTPVASDITQSHKQRARWQVLTLKRGPDTRCTGAWEIVHGRIEPSERAEQAAVREVREETGLVAVRLYNITVNAFYLHHIATVQLSLVFAAIVEDSAVTLGAEHDAFRWRTLKGADKVLAWPREREALVHVRQLLRGGDAGKVEDVLRVF